MTFDEQICFAKVYSAVMGFTKPESITSQEKEVVCEVLKKIAEKRSDWTSEQIDLYKAMVDYAKEQIEK